MIFDDDDTDPRTERLRKLQHDPDYHDQHIEPDPDLLLWRAVLMQALLDVTFYEATRREFIEARDAAHRWIVASVGVTAQDFEDVCHLAGVEPEKFRRQALSLIERKQRFMLREWGKSDDCG
jgi:hypothetical protein